jgi:hypothetical protein
MKVFLHIGYPKNASTSLETFLFPSIPNSYYVGRRYRGESSYSSPEVEEVMENIVMQDSTLFSLEYSKEIIYKDIELNSNESENIIVSSESFTNNVIDRGVIAERLYAIFPNAKILLIIREQLSSLLSMYSFLVTEQGGNINLSYGKPSVKSFNQWILSQEEFKHRSYYETLKYYNLIKYYKKLFNNNITVLIYEELIHEPDLFAQKLADYLEIDCTAEFKEKLLKRTNKSMYGIKLIYFKFRNTIWFKIFGFKYIPARTIANYFGIGKESKKTNINPILRKKLLDLYQIDNRKLQDVFGISISKYNYSL